jgi:3-oxoacyl-[acyl-carrier-protein] synthase III
MAIGIKSVGYAVPSQVRRNGYWYEHHPELVATAERRSLAHVWSRREAEGKNIFDEAMEPYLDDPFRGAVERRILADGETGLTLEVAAARRTLAAARWTPSEVDLLLVSSFLPDQYGPGNAAYVVRDLDLRCPGINLESACSSSLVSLNTAVGLVQAGHYRNALVVASCSYSRLAPPEDTLSWFMGDGAGAMLVGEVPDGHGWIAAHTVHTASTCGTFRLDLVVDDVLGPVPRMAASKDTARIINETGEPYMREACFGALAKAGIGVRDVACMVVNTPTAWYADFASRVLGIPRDRIVSTYERFANTGAALMPMNLHESVHQGKLTPGDWVLLYAVGSVSTAVATVMRWSDASLGAVAPMHQDP